MTPLPAIPTHQDLEQRVQELLRRWRAETAHLSSSTRIAADPAYQGIISLGTPALPFLFRDLEQTHDGHLSKALRAITGARLVSPEDCGQIHKVAEALLRWQ